jgi:DDE superfamily endonuclease
MKQKQTAPTNSSSADSPLDKLMLDLYSDYLISSFGYTTATGMSAALSNAVSHDSITRFLSEREYTNKDLWKVVKPVIRQIESDDSILALDDTIEEKPYTDENDIIAWHFDHTFGRNVKGVNILNLVYHNSLGTIPVGMSIIKKDIPFTDPKTGKAKRRSSVTKNELARELIGNCLQNQIRFGYVLADCWFSSQDNMEYIMDRGKHFIFALKSNRTLATSSEDKRSGIFQAISELEWAEQEVKTVYLKGMDIPVRITRQVFTNEDDSTGMLYLATDDLTLDYGHITAIYQKRWNVEEYHKSTKSNLGLAKSPGKTVTTQSNHFFAVAVAYHKLERLSQATRLNQFALKSKLYLRAQQMAWRELEKLKEVGSLSRKNVGYAGGFA